MLTDVDCSAGRLAGRQAGGLAGWLAGESGWLAFLFRWLWQAVGLGASDMAQVITVTIVWLFLEVPFLTILGGEKPPKNGGLFFRQIIHFAHT